MPQTIYIDRDNNVRVVESGPIGPAGFGGGGASGPRELLPVTAARLAPFVGWSQMGVPFQTTSFFGHRVGIAFLGMPMVTVSLETLFPLAPLYISAGGDVNFSVTAMGVDFAGNNFPEGVTLRVIAQVANLSGGETEERVIGEGPLLGQNFTGPPESQEFFDELIESLTQRYTFNLALNESILGISMQAYDSEGAPFDLETMNLVCGLVKTSMWVGDPEADAVVDINAPYTLLGQQAQTVLSTIYNSGGVFGGSSGTFLQVFGGGIIGMLPIFDDGEFTGIDSLLGPVPDNEAAPTSLVWQTSKMRVLSPPDDPTSVVRLMDVPDITPGFRTAPPEDNYLLIGNNHVVDPRGAHTFKVQLTTGENFSWSWANIPDLLTATPTVVIYGPEEGSVVVTVSSANGYNAIKEIKFGEIWLARSTQWIKTPSEDPDLSEGATAFFKVQDSPGLTEVPKTRLMYAQSVVDGGLNKIAIDTVRTDLPTPEGLEFIDFVNPGLNKYAVLEFGYVAGPPGSAWVLPYTNQYHGGKWIIDEDPESPTLGEAIYAPGDDLPDMIPGTYYRYRVRVTGTAEGLPTISDCDGGPFS